MANQPGYKVIVKVSTDGTSYTTVAVKNCTLDETVDLSDITNFVTTSTDYAAGLSAARRKMAQLHDSSISMSGDYDGSTEMSTTLRPGADVYILIGIDTSGDGSINDVIGNAKMIISNRSRVFNVENPNTVDFSAEGNGPVKTTATY